MIPTLSFSSIPYKKLIFPVLTLALTYTLKAQNAETVKIDPVNTIELSEIFESVRVVGLEKEHPALFGFISTLIKVAGSKIYIRPLSQNRRMIFGYDLSEKLPHVIDNFCPGPDQLGRVVRFEAVSENQLSINSQEKGRFYDYDVLEDKIIASYKYTGSELVSGQFIKNPETDDTIF